MATHSVLLKPGMAIHRLDDLEKRSIFILLGSIALAVLFPYPATKFLLAFLLGLYFVHLCFVRIELALCFFIFFMPVLDLFPPTFLGIKGINAQTILIALLVLGSFTKMKKHHIEKTPADPLGAPILFFIFIVLFSIFNSSIFAGYSFVTSLTIAKQWLIYTVLYFIVLRVCDSEYHEKIFYFIIFVITIAVAFSLRNYITGNAVLSERQRNLGSVLTGQPNLFGGFLAMYIPFFVSLLYTKTKWRYFFGGGLIVCIIALITTLSRGAWLAAFAGLLVLGVIKDRKLLIFLAVAVTFAPLWLPGTALDRYHNTVLSEEDSRRFEDQRYDGPTEVRRRQWKGLYKMMSPHPITGSGFNTFFDVVVKSKVLPSPKAAHSTIILLGVEEGIIGVCGYFWILFTVFKNSWHVFKKPENQFYQMLTTGLLGCITALFVADLSGTRFYCSELMAYFWIISAVVIKANIDSSNIEYRGKSIV